MHLVCGGGTILIFLLTTLSTVNQHFAQGANLILTDISEEVLEKFKAELGDRVTVFAGNITEEKDLKSLINFAKETFGNIDILINNAGITKDTLSMQIFLCSASKRFGLKIGDTVNFYFVYSKQSGLWEYIGNFTSHATWYRDGKFIGDFVKECMEECSKELERINNDSPSHIYIIDDYLTLYVIHNPILPDLQHIPKGHHVKRYCSGNDWLIGFPEISFHRDTIAVSSKAFMAKDYKSDFNIREYLQCTLYYQYNSDTQTWVNCKKETEIIKKQ